MKISLTLLNAGADEFEVMALLRQRLNLSFGDARDLTFNLPSQLLPLEEGEARQLLGELVAAGATVSDDPDAAATGASEPAEQEQPVSNVLSLGVDFDSLSEENNDEEDETREDDEDEEYEDGSDDEYDDDDEEEGDDDVELDDGYYIGINSYINEQNIRNILRNTFNYCDEEVDVIIGSLPCYIPRAFDIEDEAREYADLFKEAGATTCVEYLDSEEDAADEEDAEADEATQYYVSLDNVGNSSIMVVNTVRILYDLGIAEAKAIVDSVPVTIPYPLCKGDAEAVIGKLREAGAEAHLKSSF